MSKTYITFGQIHVHRVNGKTFDCDCVAVINHEGDEGQGRKLAFEYFGHQWHESFDEERFERNADMMDFYPRGLIEVNRDGSR